MPAKGSGGALPGRLANGPSPLKAKAPAPDWLETGSWRGGFGIALHESIRFQLVLPLQRPLILRFNLWVNIFPNS